MGEAMVSTIVSIYYKMANGDMIEQSKVILVNPPESKSVATTKD